MRTATHSHFGLPGFYSFGPAHMLDDLWICTDRLIGPDASRLPPAFSRSSAVSNIQDDKPHTLIITPRTALAIASRAPRLRKENGIVPRGMRPHTAKLSGGKRNAIMTPPATCRIRPFELLDYLLRSSYGHKPYYMSATIGQQ